MVDLVANDHQNGRGQIRDEDEHSSSYFIEERTNQQSTQEVHQRKRKHASADALLVQPELFGKNVWVLIVHLTEEKCLAEDKRKTDDEFSGMNGESFLQNTQNFLQISTESVSSL